MKLVLLRHGESVWNQENRFTGWHDIDLSPKGITEARRAGELLHNAGIIVEQAFTSFLKRAGQTLDIVLKELNIAPPIQTSWRLNERHYGALQGLNKEETAKKYGADQVFLWRRSYDIRPPAVEKSDPRYPGNDPKYRDIDARHLPVTESLKDTVERLLPYWQEAIAPALQTSKQILVAAHGNSLRGLVKTLENLSGEDIAQVELPTGIPLVYELDTKLKPIKKYFLK